MAVIEIQRAYRVALDPTRAQVEALTSHAGASRAAYNYAIAAKRAAHQMWAAAVAEATYLEHGHLGPDAALAAAKKSVKASGIGKTPTYMELIKAFCADPDNAWYSEVNRYALTSGMRAADAAWKNWATSAAGTRKGPRVGYPRFHAKGRSRDSFTIYHNVNKPRLRPGGYRRLDLPAKVGGSIRLHGNIRHLARRIKRGQAVIASVTISRGGRHWYASILARETITVPDRATPTQRAGGMVGVDLGVHHLAAYSDGTLIDNPRHLRQAQRRLTKAQRALSRTGWRRTSDGALIHDVKTRVPRQPTRRRVKAQQRLAKAHADIAIARATALHGLTKQLAVGRALVAIEDLHVAGMTRSAAGTLETPGTNVAAKSGLNRAILDVGLAEIRRQLAYKTSWYGSQLVVIDRWYPSSKTCSTCGETRAKLPLAERQYHCTTCGLRMDRDVNAARNILAAAQLVDARGKQESINARRDPPPPRDGKSTTREGQDTPSAPATPSAGTARSSPQNQRVNAA